MIKALPNYVILQATKIEKKTESGIILPEETKEQLQTGKIIDGYKELGLKKYQIVYYRMWAGEEIKAEDGKKYLIVHHRDLIAVEGGENE